MVSEITGIANQARPESKPLLIDTHLHCFAGNDPRFPYHPLAPYRPDKPATPEHLLQCMDGARIDYAIVVHPEPYQDDHRYLEYCLDIGKGRLKGTCLVFADRPGSIDKLPELAKRLPLVAARVHAYAPDRLPPFGKPELRQLWKKATELGLGMQLHFEPRYAPGFEPLIKEFSDTTVIIDHLGRPFQGTPKEHEVVLTWSRFKNTVMKLSAIPQPESYPHRNIRPVIQRLVAEYGVKRIIYGGGFSAEATPASYREALDKARSFIDFLSEEDQTSVLGNNAARLFGFKSRGN
jgi:predicted TIM-barrel fold metal-dependent hydrolase